MPSRPTSAMAADLYFWRPFAQRYTHSTLNSQSPMRMITDSTGEKCTLAWVMTLNWPLNDDLSNAPLVGVDNKPGPLSYMPIRGMDHRTFQTIGWNPECPKPTKKEQAHPCAEFEPTTDPPIYKSAYTTRQFKTRFSGRWKARNALS